MNYFSLQHWLLLVRSFWLLTKWDLTISYSKFGRWKHKLDRTAGSDAVSVNSAILKLYNRIFDKAVRHHYRSMNCLRRCLALKELLESYGWAVTLHIGVRKKPLGELEAHSWLSSKGVLVNDTQDVVSTYQEITDASVLFDQPAAFK